MNSCSRCTVGFLLLGYALADADKGKKDDKVNRQNAPQMMNTLPFFFEDSGDDDEL
jgi:hypothetical protein